MFLHLLAAALIYSGHNVTYAGTKPIQAFLVESPAAGGAVHVDLWEQAHGTTVVGYDTDMTKLLHMIVVSDDQQDFQHIHPVLQPNGHFTIDVRPAKRELYHIYIDGIPHDIGRQVMRFDVPMNATTRATSRHLNATGKSQQAGPYIVTLDSVAVPIGEIATIHVTITKNRKVANDIHPYLGAMAHGVFVGTKDLAYMHAHGMNEDTLAMAASANDCGDSMMLTMMPIVPSATLEGKFAFQLLAPTAQPYNFWLQFIGGNTLYTVPFLVNAAASH